MTPTGAGDLRAVCVRERAVIEQGPLAAPGRFGRLAPFAAVVAVAVPLILADNGGGRSVHPATVGLSLATLTAAAFLPWARLPRWAQSAFVFVPVLLVAALVQSDGGVHSQFRPLLLLPLLWLMLYETRRALWLALALMSVFIAAESVGDPSLDLARRVLPVAVGALLLPMIWRIVAVHRAAVIALAELAERDALTGALNRRGLSERVGMLHGRQLDGVGVLYLDVDAFKTVNDLEGHDAGDELLRQVAARLQAATRRDDVVARVGGDEFVVVLPGDRSSVVAVRDRVHRLVNDEPYVLPGGLVAASVTVGMSQADSVPDRPGALTELVDSLIRSADAGMRDDKPTSRPAAPGSPAPVAGQG